MAGEMIGLRSLAELEEERDFLLRSIDDLESERDAGDIEPDDYRTLKDDYTARAAAVLRSIDHLRAPPVVTDELTKPSREPTGAQRSPRRNTLLRAGVIIGVVAFAIAAGVLVERGAGQRVAGQSSSGSITQTGPNADIAKAQQLFAAGQLLPALQTLSDVLKKDPRNVEALTFTGWFTRLTAKQVNHPELVDKALSYLVRAEEADPSYGPAHLFRGITLFEDKGDATAAIPELQTFLAAPHSPDEQAQLSAVRDILARAVAATTTTTP